MPLHDAEAPGGCPGTLLSSDEQTIYIKKKACIPHPFDHEYVCFLYDETTLND
jgi:hypothetical protein